MTKVRLDLNNPEFQEQLFALQKPERNEVLSTLKKLYQMAWEQVYTDHGLRWERILSKQGHRGEALYTIRMGRGFRAVAHRDGDWMVLLTLHPDHDSAYD